MLVGNGKSIVNGIAIGKIKIYKEPERIINEGLIDDVDAEVARYEAAVEKAIDQQNILYEKAVKDAGKDIAEVFLVHAMMLEDDDLNDSVKEIITGILKY